MGNIYHSYHDHGNFLQLHNERGGAVGSEVVTWSRPSKGFVKLNIDGSHFEGLSHCGYEVWLGGAC